MAVTVGDLLPTIKKLASSYLEEIGSTDLAQNQFLFIYINNALRKLAHIAYQMKISDAMTITTDGFITFKLNSQEITNLYAPLRLLDPQGKETVRRTSFADTKGWWRESSNSQVHVKGLSGSYIFHYLTYPATVSQETSPVEFPDAGVMGLCYYCAALVVEALPSAKELAVHYYSLADNHLKVAVQANIDGRGHSSGGFVPSLVTYDSVFGR